MAAQLDEAAGRWAMTDHSERVRRLASVLSEHECWDAFETRRYRADDAEIIARTEENDWKHGIWAALRAAIVEVESGAVFGSASRCCVCGGTSNGNRQFVPADAWCCDWCAWNFLHKAKDELRLGSGDNTGDTARVILRARRLYRESKVKAAPVKRNPVREWGLTCPGGLLGSEGFLSPQDAYGMFDRWRERLGFSRKIRAEVPEKQARLCDRCGGPVVETQIPGVYLCAVNCPMKPTPPPKIDERPGAYPGLERLCREDWGKETNADRYRRIMAGMAARIPIPVRPPLHLRTPTSGNARGDGFLRDLWREEEKGTEALRRAAAPHPPGIIVTENGKCSTKCPQRRNVADSESLGRCALLPFDVYVRSVEHCPVSPTPDPCPVEAIRRAVDCKTVDAVRAEVDAIRLALAGACKASEALAAQVMRSNSGIRTRLADLETKAFGKPKKARKAAKR